MRLERGGLADRLASVPQKAAVSAVHKPPIRSVAVLLLALAVLAAPHLKAQTEILFDGTNIWVTGGSNSVTKLLASTGAIVGTYPAGPNPAGITFDGTNIWVTNNEGFSVSGPVTELLASTGATVGTYHMAGSYGVPLGPFGITFDGTNIWVTDVGSNSVTKILASTGAVVGDYSTGHVPRGRCLRRHQYLGGE